MRINESILLDSNLLLLNHDPVDPAQLFDKMRIKLEIDYHTLKRLEELYRSKLARLWIRDHVSDDVCSTRQSYRSWP